MTNDQILFKQGKDGYDTYRIPALLTLPNGRLLAFCEGRRNGLSDSGKIDIVLKISDDNGSTFSAQHTIASYGENTIGNPCPVCDRDTGRIFLFLNTNLAEGSESVINQNKAPRDVGYIFSDDCGETWSEFVNLTAELKREGWTWYATGPCHAIQMENGRLVIPCNHGVFNAEKGTTDIYESHVIVSDDHGRTWKLGASVESEGFSTNETTVETLSDGTLYLNARSLTGRPYRVVAYSQDGGDSWFDIHEDENLPDPICQGSVIAYPRSYEGCVRPLLFSNNPFPPQKEDFGHNRRDLRVRLSLDDGKSWNRSVQVHEGCTAYSDLAILADGSVAVAYERGVEHAYECIALQVFNMDVLK